MGRGGATSLKIDRNRNTGFQDRGESFWKIPSELQEAVDEFERSESQQEQAPSRTTDPTKADSAQPSSAHQPAVAAIASPPPDGGSDEYEEVEETDEEDEEGLVKRPRVEGQEENGPQEFNEDDIAFQLQAMGQDYGLDPEEYGAGEDDDAYDEGAEGLPFTEEDATGLFKDLLDDHGISPYATWEKVVEEGTIIDDDRYTVLPTMKSRKEVWAQWSRERIQHAKELKAKQEKKDPRLPYLDFMQKHATPKLYWPEFKRKYRKEAEMRDVKLSDKEREKWYRGYISRLKLSESTRKSEFTSLLKSQPLSILNNATDSSNLPTSLRTDLRFLSIDSLARDGLVRTYISTLGPPPASNGTGLDGDEEDAATVNKRKEDRERRMKALAAREAMVAQEKRRQRGALEQGRSRLHEEEEELRRAMAVGKHGLKAQLAVEVEVHRAGDDEGGDGQGQTNDGEA
ncbi:MAG: hypothetical protein M1838_005535 [Thelocarpon superellum]|nr:MAG: hypothetical protein M1838_005535 [Thelocarpon superellum]